MRQDTKVLLDRLGEETFRYYDFESPSAEIDVWPMFEALLLDERVVGPIARHSVSEAGAAHQTDSRDASASERSRQEPLVRKPLAPSDRRGMFGNYGPAGAAAETGESVRDQLQRLVTSTR